MQKVLLLTYYWPPAGGVAVQRWLKFCKYLPEHGWIPHVITVKNGSYPYIDTSLEREVPPEVNVYRMHALEPFAIYNFFRGNKGKQLPTAFLDSSARKTFFQKVAEWVRANFFIPDARLGWIPFAQRAAASIIRRENIKVVITTGPPHSTHLAGLWLKKRFEIKWVADFRDPWTNIFTNQYLPRSAYAQRKDERLESMVLSKADIITVIGPSMKKEFEGRAKKVEVIWNGYDDEDFAYQVNNRNERFTIRYVGNLLASQKASAFWRAAARMHHENKIDFLIEIIGRADNSVIEEVRKNHLEKIVCVKGFESHIKAIEAMCAADVLLFIVPDVIGNEKIITGKIFEYLAAEKPIIAIGNRAGDAAYLLRECGKDEMCDYDDEEQIFNYLKNFYAHFLKGERKPANKYHTIFSRKMQTHQLAQILSALQ